MLFPSRDIECKGYCESMGADDPGAGLYSDLGSEYAGGAWYDVNGEMSLAASGRGDPPGPLDITRQTGSENDGHEEDEPWSLSNTCFSFFRHRRFLHHTKPRPRKRKRHTGTTIAAMRRPVLG